MTYNTIFDDPAMEAQGIAWSKMLFDRLSEGGVWGVKRSGLIYQRVGDQLRLTARMPHNPAMPITAEQLNKQQQADIDIIERYFTAAGITIEDVTQS